MWQKQYCLVSEYLHFVITYHARSAPMKWTNDSQDTDRNIELTAKQRTKIELVAMKMGRKKKKSKAKASKDCVYTIGNVCAHLFKSQQKCASEQCV